MLLSKIGLYSILSLAVASVVGEGDLEPSEGQISANTETCLYKGDEYRCLSLHECLNDGGESIHQCTNGLSCCVYRHFSINTYFGGGYSQLIIRAVGNFCESILVYDLPIFSWWRWATAKNQFENSYSDSGQSEIEINDTNGSSGHGTDDYKISGDGRSHANLLSATYIDQSKPKSKSTEGKHGGNYHGCGEPRLRIKRIVGGRDSRFGHHPWQAALFKPSLKDQPFCGGALLNDRWIVTAAHCVDDPGLPYEFSYLAMIDFVPYRKPIGIIKVRLGEFDVLSKREELVHKEYEVTKKKMHPGYVNDGHRNDVALLKLERIVNFDRHIIPICLPGPNLILIGEGATVTGWGRRHHDEKKSAAPVLNEVDVEIIPNDMCREWFSDAGHDRTLDDIFICAGHRNGGRGSCKGDSGGPLSISVKGRRVLIGVVSWGFGCGRKRSPGVYANIGKYVPWILEKID